MTTYHVEVEDSSGDRRVIGVEADDPVRAAWNVYRDDTTHRETVTRVWTGAGDIEPNDRAVAVRAPLIATLAVITAIGAVVIAAALVVF